MSGDEARLVEEAERFGAEVTDLLDRTVCRKPPVAVELVANRVVVSAGGKLGIPLTIQGQHRLDLQATYWCTWDYTGEFLAIYESRFAIAVPQLNEPLVRFEYDRRRKYAEAHIQVHGENTVLGAVLGLSKPAKVPRLRGLHLPVGGKRFRPCLEDVIEFAIEEFAVDKRAGWESRIEEGRSRWREIQLAATLRDVVENGAPPGPELRDAVLRAGRFLEGKQEG